MTDKDIETLVELTAMKAAEIAIEKAKIEWAKDIQLHTAICEVRKYTSIKQAVSAIIGGSIVIVVDWIIRKI